jgi:sugar lactone lactonase YvrE
MKLSFALALASILGSILFVACGGGGSVGEDGDGGGPFAEGGSPLDGGDPEAGSVLGGASYTIGGTLSGLGAGLTVKITDNSADPLTLTADGPFTFAKKVGYGKNYSVTITTQPENQTCAVTGATGTATKAVTSVAVTCTTITPKMVLVSGKPGFSGTTDGTGTDARFDTPTGLAVDATGNVYVADTQNNTIRKITPAGVVTTLAGSALQQGSADGAGSAARFNAPQGVATDPAGNVYVADTGNQLIRQITPAGVVTTIAGLAITPGFVNGNGVDARFSKPVGIVYHGGLLYVADRNNSAVRQITLGATPSVITYQSGLTAPNGLTYDVVAGKVAESSATGEIVYDIGGTTAGGAGQSGFVNAQGTSARFHFPLAVAANATTMVVADTGNHAIRSINLSNFQVTNVAGSGAPGQKDGSTSSALFNQPEGVAIDAAGTIYVADTGNHLIRKIAGGQVTTFAGGYFGAGAADGAGSVARFNGPTGVVADSKGNLFIADSLNRVIRKVVPGGQTTRFAGTPGAPGKVNGPGSTATFSSLYGIAIDKADNLYVADVDNCLIRKITPTADVSTFAASSTGSPCPVADADKGAAFVPRGVTVDSKGNVYWIDTFFNAVWKATPAGVAAQFVGGEQGIGDGTGLGAWFNFPLGLTVDADDNLYVSDDGNSLVRKVTPAGVVTTIPFPMTDLYPSPAGIAVDRTGTIFVADIYAGVIRARKADGTTTVIMGERLQRGLQVGSLPGRFNAPQGLAVFGTSLFVVDAYENSLVEVTNIAY